MQHFSTEAYRLVDIRLHETLVCSHAGCTPSARCATDDWQLVIHYTMSRQRTSERRVNTRVGPSVFVALLFTCSALVSTAQAAVLAVDLGSEFLKVSIVKPGRTPISIVLNEM